MYTQRSVYSKGSRLVKFSKRLSSSQPLMNPQHVVQGQVSEASDSFSDDDDYHWGKANYSSPERDDESNDRVNLAIILPYIYDSTFRVYKQPILVRVKSQQLVDNGFNLPFSKFHDIVENHFKFTIKNTTLYGKIIAIADSEEALRESLNHNITRDHELKNLRRLIKVNENQPLDLIHVPLRKKGQLPQRIKLSESQILSIFSINNLCDIANKEPQDLPSVVQAEVESHTDRVDTDQMNHDHLTKNGVRIKAERIKSLRAKISSLESKKSLLSEYDATSMMVKTLIDITKELFEIIDEESCEYETEMNYIVPMPDQTYKKTAMNRVYIEGILPLDLNLYEHGIKGAKFNKPPSIAYQLVKSVFPEHYYFNVHFGKRELTSVEVEKRKNHLKKPLVYVLGFNDPLDNPFQGEFSMSLGRKRIRALIDHIFRKAGKIQYTKSEEMQVRARIIKEFSSKNRQKILAQPQERDSNADESSEDSSMFQSDQTQHV